MKNWIAMMVGAALTVSAMPIHAEKGPVTGKDMPRFVSIKATRANARQGPSTNHKIKWVFQRRGMPVRVVAEFGHWRQVEDVDGEGGWIHYALLSNARTVIIFPDDSSMRYDPSVASQIKARVEKGVVANVDECDTDWCLLVTPEITGWMRKVDLWGVAAKEVID